MSSNDFVVAVLRLVSETFDHASHQAHHCARRRALVGSGHFVSGHFFFALVVRLLSREKLLVMIDDGRH